MTSVAGWLPPPERPVLDPGEAAVWRLERGTDRPIESVAARYLGDPPQRVRIARTTTGKPELAGAELAVGLSHSGEVVLVGVAPAGDVGVDVEALRPDAAGWALVGQALTEREQEGLESLAPADRAESFLRIWTRKEAILKAAGTGLAVDPRRVELDGLDVVSVPTELGAGGDWTLVDVPLAGHAAALAVRGPLLRLFLFDARP